MCELKIEDMIYYCKRAKRVYGKEERRVRGTPLVIVSRCNSFCVHPRCLLSIANSNASQNAVFNFQ